MIKLNVTKEQTDKAVEDMKVLREAMQLISEPSSDKGEQKVAELEDQLRIYKKALGFACTTIRNDDKQFGLAIKHTMKDYETWFLYLAKEDEK